MIYSFNVISNGLLNPEGILAEEQHEPFYHITGGIRGFFANGPGDQSSIPSRRIPKTQKMVLDAALISTQYYKVRIKGKVEQSWELSRTLPYTEV